MVAAAGIILGLIVACIAIRLWWRVEATKADARATAHNDHLVALEALTAAVQALVNKPYPEPPTPPDFSFLEDFVAQHSHALQSRMDTINADMAILTTRVETGPGKRTINFP